MTFGHSEDSDQPGHPPSLIRVFAVSMRKTWVLSYPLSAQRRLIRWGGCPGWSESLLGAQSFCWFCHETAHLSLTLSIHPIRGDSQNVAIKQISHHKTNKLHLKVTLSVHLSRNYTDKKLNKFNLDGKQVPLDSINYTFSQCFLTVKNSHVIMICAASWQNQQNDVCPAKTPTSLGICPVWSVFTVCMKKAWVLGYPLSAQWRLIRLGGCPGWSESSLGAHSFCWFCHEVAHISNNSTSVINSPNRLIEETNWS